MRLRRERQGQFIPCAEIAAECVKFFGEGEAPPWDNVNYALRSLQDQMVRSQRYHVVHNAGLRQRDPNTGWRIEIAL